MDQFPTAAWLAIGLIALVAVVGQLYVLSSVIKEQTGLHELRIEAERIRREFLLRLRPQEPIEVDEAPPEMVAPSSPTGAGA